MPREEILEKVIELFSLMSDVEEITEESELMEDLDISSMEILSVIANIEEEFQIKVNEKAIRRMIKISNVVDVIAELL